MTEQARTKQFIFRASETELAMLRAVAESQGIAAADVLRMCIRERYRALYGDKRPTRTRRR